MTDVWLTYAQAAERLNLTVEAVRLRALRGRWQKTIGNDKRPRIRLPEGWSNDVQTTVERRERKPRNDGRTTVERAADAALIAALEGHVATLKAELEHRAGELETLKAQLAGAEGRASKESAKTAQAIAAFEALAQRLEEMAEAKRPPWWRLLLRRAG
jgi:DNA repair exonuclease SbcCD ATPase subunit